MATIVSRAERSQRIGIISSSAYSNFIIHTKVAVRTCKYERLFKFKYNERYSVIQ
nr:MAG TPA: hypothetical protein [Caudoviricetes sp.]